LSELLRRLAVLALVALNMLAIAPAAHALPQTDPGAVAAAPTEASDPPGRGFFRWPTAGRLTQPYGCTGFRMNRARGSCPFFHNGIDIANERGTPILAAAGGVIAHVGWDPYDRSRDPAWVVIIRHRDGLRSWYAHMLPKKVRGAREGQRVRRGQLIGYMGDTGKATGVHLHFMAENRGRFVNPRRFLAAGERRPPRHVTDLRLVSLRPAWMIDGMRRGLI
jgi:murein DD-endopeptidase MepM/ murein hydrolase activator NlpD